MTRIDFPAAHSMDTAWFAVDRDGNVALFETGEAGALPAGAADEEGAAYGHLEELAPRCEGLRVPPVPAYVGDDQHGVRPEHHHRALFHLRDAKLLAAELSTGKARRVSSEGSEAVVVEAPDAALFARLHAAGDCLGCEYWFEAEGETPAAKGLYQYEHACDNWIAGPYRLHAKPSQPLRAEDLPRGVKLVRFEGRFEETQLLQPMNAWPCESWEPAWLDVDGRTVRPVPGREDDYAEQLADLREGGEGLVFTGIPAARTARKPLGAGKAAPAQKKPWWKFW
jgi:hypothetical protein